MRAGIGNGKLGIMHTFRDTVECDTSLLRGGHVDRRLERVTRNGTIGREEPSFLIMAIKLLP